MITLANALQRFFTERLCTQMEASSHTIAGYRDTLRLLLQFISQKRNQSVSTLTFDELTMETILEFLNHVETQRNNVARSRNTRLAAIRSFFRFLAMYEPARMQQCQQILAIPSKRYDRKPIDFLTHDELNALLKAPDRSIALGQRDYFLLLIAIQTGLRASELINLRCSDFVFGTGAHVRCLGKGRKQRCTPLKRDTAKTIQDWIRTRGIQNDAPLFVTAKGQRLSRDALEHLVKKHVVTASKTCSTLIGKRVTPHVLRHSTAMELLHGGVDQTVIALWLGHESVETTQIYIHADMKLKEKALERLKADESTVPVRYKPDDELLTFLESL